MKMCENGNMILKRILREQFVCDVDRIGLGKGLTLGYGEDSDRASELVIRENFWRYRMSADYFSKYLCATWELADQIIVSCLVGWSID